MSDRINGNRPGLAAVTRDVSLAPRRRAPLADFSGVEVCVYLRRLSLAAPRLTASAAEARVWRRIVLRKARMALQEARIDLYGGRMYCAMTWLAHAAELRDSVRPALRDRSAA